MRILVLRRFSSIVYLSIINDFIVQTISLQIYNSNCDCKYSECLAQGDKKQQASSKLRFIPGFINSSFIIAFLIILLYTSLVDMYKYYCTSIRIPTSQQQQAVGGLLLKGRGLLYS